MNTHSIWIVFLAATLLSQCYSTDTRTICAQSAECRFRTDSEPKNVAYKRDDSGHYWHDRWRDLLDIFTLTANLRYSLGLKIDLSILSIGAYGESHEISDTYGLRGGKLGSFQTLSRTFILGFQNSTGLIYHKECFAPSDHQMRVITAEGCIPDIHSVPEQQSEGNADGQFTDFERELSRGKYYQSRHPFTSYRFGRMEIQIGLLLTSVRFGINIFEAGDFITSLLPFEWADLLKDDSYRYRFPIKRTP
ncbi:MAG: hypothetical protein KDK30_02620 [Leptospiraceae bacterium]|nr:hypothetical protein [Leptospiraceae bacterium]MCB1316951.1 hypothetical protein [Leptospiraceae bacterium]